MWILRLRGLKPESKNLLGKICQKGPLYTRTSLAYNLKQVLILKTYKKSLYTCTQANKIYTSTFKILL